IAILPGEVLEKIQTVLWKVQQNGIPRLDQILPWRLWELQGDPVQEFRGFDRPPFVIVKQFEQFGGDGFETVLHHGPGRGPFVQVDEHIAKIQDYVIDHFCIWIGCRPIYVVFWWAFPRSWGPAYPF